MSVGRVAGVAGGASIARCVDYWLWALSVGLTEDPRRCARIVATLLPEG